MLRSRFARKLDRNHRTLKEYAEDLGLTCETIQGRKGCPDLLVGAWKVTRVVEVKPAKAKGVRRSETAPRDSQKDWHDEWRGSPVVVWRTTADVDRTAAEMRAESERKRGEAFEARARFEGLPRNEFPTQPPLSEEDLSDDSTEGRT